jgi:ABC-type multidrug transport system ATPase subunit
MFYKQQKSTTLSKVLTSSIFYSNQKNEHSRRLTLLETLKMHCNLQIESDECKQNTASMELRFR